MTQHCEAVYENGVFRPLAPLGFMVAEGQQVQLVVETKTASDNILGLMAQVYAGLSEEDINAIEQIAFNRP